MLVVACNMPSTEKTLFELFFGGLTYVVVGTAALLVSLFCVFIHLVQTKCSSSH